jgi:hypothetical protein
VLATVDLMRPTEAEIELLLDAIESWVEDIADDRTSEYKNKYYRDQTREKLKEVFIAFLVKGLP